MQRAAVDDDQRPPGRARSSSALLDRAARGAGWSSSAAGRSRRRRPARPSSFSYSSQRDVEHVRRDAQLLRLAQQPHDLALGLGRTLGRARHLLGHARLALAALAGGDPCLDDQVRRVRRDDGQDVVGEARDRRPDLRRRLRLVQLAERDDAARLGAAASRPPPARDACRSTRGLARQRPAAAAPARASNAAAAIRPTVVSRRPG